MATSALSARGRALRQPVPRGAHAELALPADRDPVGVLAAQHESRLTELVPVRIGRMLQSPFAFYRGAAAVMAADLRAGVTTGVRVVSCGDAHLSNFGFFASPERNLLFDLNDFDEGGVGPWEWDVKRLAASVHIGGRDLGMDEEACTDATAQVVRLYRTVLRELAEVSALERYFHRVDSSAIEELVTSDRDRKLVRKVADKARRRTSDRVLAKIATRDDDGLRIVDQPPITRHVDHATLDQLNVLFARYCQSLREDVALLLGQYRLVDYVLRVVGVGSVGTRCYVLAFEGPTGDVLFLQAKEAQPSVLVSHGGMPATIPGAAPHTPRTEGHRVVAVQRILQAQSDPFLGWITGWAGEREDRPRVDYYWRQFRDMKGSVDLDTLTAGQFRRYGRLCGRLLARAHAQSSDADRIADYLGSGEAFDAAVARWARAYADIAESDFEMLRHAVASGRLPAEHGV